MHLKQPIYLALLALTFILSLYRWRILSAADRMIAILLGLTVIQETAAFICLLKVEDNLFTYHFYSPLEFLLISLYFNESNKILNKYHIGKIIGISGVLLSVVNTIFFQPLTVFNSYFLLFEGTFIIIMCLFSLSDILWREVLDFQKSTYFWMTVVIMFYWCVTYMGWGVFNLIGIKNRELKQLFILILYVANLFFYMAISVMFIYYKRLNRHGT